MKFTHRWNIGIIWNIGKVGIYTDMVYRNYMEYRHIWNIHIDGILALYGI